MAGNFGNAINALVKSAQALAAAKRAEDAARKAARKAFDDFMKLFRDSEVSTSVLEQLAKQYKNGPDKKLRDAEKAREKAEKDFQKAQAEFQKQLAKLLK